MKGTEPARIKWDAIAHLAPAVLIVVSDCGPLTTKQIKLELDKRGHGRPHASAINKALTQYLADKVHQVEKGKWAMRCPPLNS